MCASWGLDIALSQTNASGVGALLQIADHPTGKTYLPTYDVNGNIIALVTADNTGGGTAGALAAAYEYSPFGEPLRAQTYDPVVADNPWRFSTKFTDLETGLVYYGLRYYNPKDGRFINRDPIEEQGGLNLYCFCGNDSVNHYDVLGRLLGIGDFFSWLGGILFGGGDDGRGAPSPAGESGGGYAGAISVPFRGPMGPLSEDDSTGSSKYSNTTNAAVNVFPFFQQKFASCTAAATRNAIYLLNKLKGITDPKVTPSEESIAKTLTSAAGIELSAFDKTGLPTDKGLVALSAVFNPLGYAVTQAQNRLDPTSHLNVDDFQADLKTGTPMIVFGNDLAFNADGSSSDPGHAYTLQYNPDPNADDAHRVIVYDSGKPAPAPGVLGALSGSSTAKTFEMPLSQAYNYVIGVNLPNVYTIAPSPPPPTAVTPGPQPPG